MSVIALGSASAPFASASAESPKPNRPQVRNSATVVAPKPEVRAKALDKIVCEGGQVKTSSSGFVGCSCGLNVRRITVSKNHYRCDRPQVRNSSVTKSGSELPGKQGPRAVHSADVEPKTPRSDGKPVPQNRSTGKAVSACRGTLSASRKGATTRGFALSTAVAAWEHGAGQQFGFHMRKWKNASDKQSECSKGAVLWTCTVSARPCPPA
jgi:hypothetical protein